MLPSLRTSLRMRQAEKKSLTRRTPGCLGASVDSQPFDTVKRSPFLRNGCKPCPYLFNFGGTTKSGTRRAQLTHHATSVEKRRSLEGCTSEGTSGPSARSQFRLQGRWPPLRRLPAYHPCRQSGARSSRHELDGSVISRIARVALRRTPGHSVCICVEEGKQLLGSAPLEHCDAKVLRVPRLPVGMRRGRSDEVRPAAASAAPHRHGLPPRSIAHVDRLLLKDVLPGCIDGSRRQLLRHIFDGGLEVAEIGQAHRVGGQAAAVRGRKYFQPAGRPRRHSEETNVARGGWGRHIAAPTSAGQGGRTSVGSVSPRERLRVRAFQSWLPPENHSPQAQPLPDALPGEAGLHRSPPVP